LRLKRSGGPPSHFKKLIAMSRGTNATAKTNVDQMNSICINNYKILMSLNAKIAWESAVPKVNVLAKKPKGC
jgi:hypothetical protein